MLDASAGSMCESEVQTLIALIRRGLQVRLLVLLRHTAPNALSLLIDHHVENFGSNKQRKVIGADSNQNLVASPVKRLIVLAVDVLADDTARLNGHVVQS